METNRSRSRASILWLFLFLAAVLCLMPMTAHAGHCRYNQGCGCSVRGLSARNCQTGIGLECWVDDSTHSGCNGHNWKPTGVQGSATCTQAPYYEERCSRCGHKRWVATGQAFGHISSGWTDGGGDHYIYCTRGANGCNHSVLARDQHHYGAYIQDNENTHHQVCNECGHILTDAHDFGSWEKAPERPGWEKSVCKQCGWKKWRDSAAPEVCEITASPIEKWTAGDGSVTMKAQDKGSGLVEVRLYRKDVLTGQENCVASYNGNKQTTVQTFTYTEQTEGRWTYRMEAVDALGNLAKAGPTKEVWIDHSNPQETANIGGQSNKTETRTGTRKTYKAGPKKTETQYKDEPKAPIYDTTTVTIKGEEKTTKYNEISYDLAGGQHNGMAPYEYINGTAAVVPDPVRDGYSFGGWTVTCNGKDIVSTPTKGITISKDSTGDLKFTAHWGTYYGVTFHGNGADGGTKKNIEIGDVSYGESFSLSKNGANGFTRTGYTFTGWNTEADGSGTSYADNATVKNLTKETEVSVDLYAQWKINQYTIKFNANGGSGSMANESMTYAVSKALTNNAFTRTGYTFQGWATSASGGKVYSNGQSVSNLASANGAVVNLYAVWSKNTYTISYNYNGGNDAGNPRSYQVDTASFTLKNPTRPGYTFIGWTGSNGSSAQASVTIAKGSTGNKSYTANWRVNNYTANFNGNGGSNGTAITKEYGSQLGTLPSSSRIGYTFAGWFTAASGGAKISTTTTMPIGGATYYAHWNVNSYTITRQYRLQNADGTYGDYITIDSNAYTYGSTVPAWNRAQNNDYKAASIAAYNVGAGGNTLQTNVDRRTFTISYTLNGGSIKNQLTSYLAGQSVTIPQPTRSGYTFAGWTGTGLTDRTLNVSIGSNARTNISLTAEWKTNLDVEERIVANAASGSYMTLGDITDQNGYYYNPETNTGNYEHRTSPAKSYVIYYQGPSQYNNSNYHLTVPTYSGDWEQRQARDGKSDIKWYGADNNLPDSSPNGMGVRINERPNSGGGNWGNYATPGNIWQMYGANFTRAMYIYAFDDGTTPWVDFYPAGGDYVKDQDYPNGRPLISVAYLYKNGTQASQAVDAIGFAYQLLGYVNYNPNGGSGSGARVQQRFGTNIVLQGITDTVEVGNINGYAGTRNGYTFLGWSGMKDGEIYHTFYWNPWLHSSEYLRQHGAGENEMSGTLYAQWSRTSATITSSSVSSSPSKPQISSSLPDITVKKGTSPALKVTASGSGLTYSWQYRYAHDNIWHDWGDNNKGNPFTPDKVNDIWQGLNYRVKVTDSKGNTSYSNIGKITVTN